MSSWIAPAAGVVFDRIAGSMLASAWREGGRGMLYSARMRRSGTEKDTSLCRVAD